MTTPGLRSARGRVRAVASGIATAMRHLMAILLLPTMVAVVVPWWLVRSHGAAAPVIALPGAALVLLRICAAGIGLLGATLFAWCVLLFVRVGRGTLAPWDPTKRLVVAGPYRHVRNPMISGVTCVLVAEALFAASARLAACAIVFVAINHAFFVAVEEPGLRRRFGAEYDEYLRAVPRWLPRRRAWRGRGASR